MLRQHIVPRLVAEAPQPDTEALEADALLPRLTLIFDREGYSPDFFAELKAQRIAILTYHKFPGEKWPATEFASHQVFIKKFDSGSLCIFVPPSVNRPALRMAANFLGRWLDKQLAAIRRKLDNESFLSRAPAEVVAQQRAREAELLAQRAAVLGLLGEG